MSSASSSPSPSKPLLMIPGPVEYHASVLEMLGRQSLSHVSPAFIEEFGSAIEQTRRVFLTSSGQPLILSGSGTLGWDIILANLCEAGDRAICINTGYFSDSFTACAHSYDVQVDTIQRGIGETASPNDIFAALTEAKANGKRYKLALFTHVDTSTAVRNDVKAWTKIIKDFDANILVAVDGVCSFGGEEFRMDDWKIDAAMTCSQKAIGVPPGLSIVALSQLALSAFESRKSKVPAYYISLHNWLPIMRAYEKRTPSYFATPNVNLIRSLRVALSLLLNEAGGMEQVFHVHEKTAKKFRAALAALKLQLLPTSEAHAANTLSAIYYPSSIDKTKLLPALVQHGVVAAGGLHKDCKANYFRIGHMGVSVWDPKRNDIAIVVQALEDSLIQSGATITPGTAIKAFNSA